MIYDFILFENYFLAKNHYKDVCIIAKMMKACGYSVAIADILEEGTECIVEDIPHITFRYKCTSQYYGKDKPAFLRVPLNLWNQYKYERYLVRVMRELKGHFRNLYAGSYWTGMSLSWIKEIPMECNCFFWGLRSSRLGMASHQGIHTANAIQLNSYFKEHSNLKFFVSDNLIKNEFLQLGFDERRLVIRPERYICKLTEAKAKPYNKPFIILSIGSLRREKQLEIAIDAFNKIENDNLKYIIAGKNADERYEAELAELYKKNIRIERRNYRLSEEEYSELIDICDCLLLSDMQQQSIITNGTMNEVLLRGKPIIAPNYNPYTYYIEKYNIGKLFDPLDNNSIVNSVLHVMNVGIQYYTNNIKEYQKTFLFKTIVENFSKELTDKTSKE